MTEAAWTARWEVFAADAIRAAAHARDEQASAERRIEELEASDSTDDGADSADDDEDSADDDEEYGWDGSPVSSDEDWEAWLDKPRRRMRRMMTSRLPFSRWPATGRTWNSYGTP